MTRRAPPRRPTGGPRGFAAAEYLAIVAAIGLMLAGLLTLRAHEAGRTPPIRAIPVLAKLLATPQRLLRPPVVPRPPISTRPPRRPRRPPVRRPTPPPIVIQVPEWLLR